MAWYYIKDGEQKGPVDETEFESLRISGVVGGDTMVWKKGMDGWKAYGELAAGASPSAPGEEMVTCSISGQQVKKSEAIEIDGRWISAAHKNEALQRLKEGAEMTGGSLRYAGFWIRFAAVFIDGLITGIPTSVFQGLVTNAMQASGIGEENPIFVAVYLLQILLGLCLAITYYTWMVGRYQATLGKMVLKLKVVRSDGSALTYGRAFGRYWGFVLSAFTMYVGCIIAAFDDQRRSLHDRICDTRVVYAK